MTPGIGRAFDNMFVAAAAIGVIVTAAALAGILTRPIGHSAVFWPANAVLLGLLLRAPQFARPLSLAGAAAGYIAADRLTGGAWAPTLWMTAANMAGCLAGYLLFVRVYARDRELRQPGSFMRILLVCAVAAGVSAFIAVFLAPPLFGLQGMQGWFGWFSAEFLNYQITLPVVLTFPTADRLRRQRQRPARRLQPLPALALIAAVTAGTLIGGPGVIGFGVPPLLWCALTYGLFATALLTAGFATWTMLSLAAGWTGVSIGGDYLHNLTSAYLGIALISLMPVTVASVTLTRNHLMRRLERAATRDFLTDALNRSAFTALGNRMLAEGAAAGRPVSALMLDLDRFKRINDTHGHAAGDKVLQAFARTVAAALRDDDLFGRVGGEEFAVLLPCAADDAAAIAERIRKTFADQRLTIEDGTVLQGTVSIGLAAGTDDLEALLARADDALYRAKNDGRDRVAVAI